jgi:copper transport protein
MTRDLPAVALRAPDAGTLLGALAGLLPHGPFITRLPLGRTLDATLLQETLRTRFGGSWAVRVLVLLLLVGFLRAWAGREDAWARAGARVAVGVLAAALVVTPALSGHAATGPYGAVGAVVGVVHYSAAAVWFGGLVLLGICVLPRAEVGLLQVPEAGAGAAELLEPTVTRGSSGRYPSRSHRSA